MRGREGERDHRSLLVFSALGVRKGIGIGIFRENTGKSSGINGI